MYQASFRDPEKTTEALPIRPKAAAPSTTQPFGSMDSVLGCAAPVVDAVKEHLISTAKEEFRVMWYLEDEINNTSKFINTLRSVEEVAERKQLEDEAVRKWLLEFKNAVYDKEDVECDYREMVVRVEDGQRVLTWWKGRAKDGLLLLCSIPLCCLKDILPLPITPRIEIARKLRTININLAKIDQQRTELVSLAGGSSDDAAKKQVSSPQMWKYKARSMIGREEIKSEIKETLLKHIETSCSKLLVIGIVGAGGMGKTTLAHSIFNDEKVMDAFDTKKWLYVGENSDIKEIMNRIISDSSNNPDNANDILNDNIKNNKNDTRGNSDLQNSDRIKNVMKEISNLQSPDIINDVRNEIIDSGDSKVEDPDYLHSRMIVKYRKKNVLIVLDDVWCTKAEEWDLLQTSLSNETKANALIVTTRNKAAARAIPHESIYFEHELVAMRDDECMEIFERWAFMRTPPHKIKEFEGLSRQVVQKLKGVPLAAEIMGRFLYNHLDDKERWHDIINHQLVTDDGNVIDKITGLSYIHLPTHLKHCFAYCAMFPKGHKFDKKDLVQMWIVQGYVLPRKNELQEHTGKNYFNDLYLRSLFQLDRDDIDTQYFVVHDLIHDFACKIFIEGHRVDTSDSHQDHYTTVENLPKRIRHLTLEFGGSESSSTEITRFDVTKLRSLICHGNLGLEYVLTNKFRYLRLLIIRYHDMEELPHSIQHLKLLQYLDVSETGIKSLPEATCDLVSLQYLNLPNNCTALPEGMSKLVKLRFVKTSKYEKIAYASIREIGKLTDLQGHDLYFTVQNRSGWEISELKGLNHLHGTLTIDGLEHVKSKKEAEKACLEKKGQIETLVLRWNVSEPRRQQDHIADDMQEFSFSPSEIEEERDTISSRQQDRIVDGQAEEMLEGLCPPRTLNSLAIHNYHGAWPPRWMENSNCFVTELKFHGVTITKAGNGVHVGCLLPCLLKLIIKDCPKMTSLSPIISLQDTDELQVIVIINCPDLGSLQQRQDGDGTGQPLQCLEVIKLKGCPKLTSLMPISLRGLDKLQMIAIVNCPELALWQQEDGDGPGWSLPCLEVIKIKGCSKLTSLMPINLHGLEKLKYIQIVNCPELASLQQQVGDGPRWPLPCLEEIKIERCLKLTSLMPISLRGMDKLKYIQIINCPELGSLQQQEVDGPGWPLPCLEVMEIEGCLKLTSLMPISLRCLDKLKYIQIINCPELASLQQQDVDGPGWPLPCLEAIQIEGCPKLTSLMPISLHGLDKLKYIIITNCPELGSLQQQHTSDRPRRLLLGLIGIGIKGCPKLTSLMPIRLRGMDKLKYIKLMNCLELGSLQQQDGDGLGWPFPCLEEIVIEGCPKLISLMPISLCGLDILRTIKIINCPMLASFQQKDGDGPGRPLPCLEEIKIEGCPQLTSMMPISLRGLDKLRIIQFINCPKFASLQQPDGDGLRCPLPCLEAIQIEGCLKLTSLMPISLRGLDKLRIIQIINCPELVSLQQQDTDEPGRPFPCLEAIQIEGCPKLTSLMPINLRGFNKLRIIQIINCPDLVSLQQQQDGDGPGQPLQCLEVIKFEGCPKLTSRMPISLRGLDKLQMIAIVNCPELASLDQEDVAELGWPLLCLESIQIEGCPKLTSLIPISLFGLNKLRIIKIINCPELATLQQQDGDGPGFPLLCLDAIQIEGCPKLSSLMPISLRSLDKLRIIQITNCLELASLQQQDEDETGWPLPCLEEIKIERCPKLTSLVPISLRGLDKLQVIAIVNCHELASLLQEDKDGPSWPLPCLDAIQIEGCPKLTYLLPITLHGLDKLRIIQITNCLELASLQQQDGNGTGWPLPCLEKIKIEQCPKLTSLMPISLRGLDKLKYIQIINCFKLALLQQQYVDGPEWRFPCLEGFHIEGCPKLTSLMPINLCGLEKLKYIIIINCPELGSLQQQDTDGQLLLCLEGIVIKGCPKLTSLMPISLRGLNKLRIIKIIDCPELASLQQEDGDGPGWSLPCLEVIKIEGCSKLTSLMPINLRGLEKLKYIQIVNCPELASLQQQVGDGPRWPLPCLEEIKIERCLKLTSLMPISLRGMDKLKYIQIINCPELGSLQQKEVDGPGWPLPCLEVMEIEGCPKLTPLKDQSACVAWTN